MRPAKQRKPKINSTIRSIIWDAKKKEFIKDLKRLGVITIRPNGYFGAPIINSGWEQEEALDIIDDLLVANTITIISVTDEELNQGADWILAIQLRDDDPDCGKRVAGGTHE